MNDGYLLMLRAALAPLGIDPGGNNWRHFARCKSVDPELFFPVGDTPAARKQTATAKAICASCPVKDICLEWSLEESQDAGVWGGEDEATRRRMRRERRGGTFTHGTTYGYDDCGCRCPRCTKAKADARKKKRRAS